MGGTVDNVCISVSYFNHYLKIWHADNLNNEKDINRKQNILNR
jgi:hypothetical protein